MSRRAKKQQSDRAPVSGTRFSNERPNQRKKQRAGRREQKRRQAKAQLVIVPSGLSNSARPDAVAAAAPGAAELAPPRALASLPPAPSPSAEPPLADDALLDVERSFFEGWSLPEPAAPDSIVTASQPDPDEGEVMLLTPEQQQRRRWFRRHVATLVAGMGAFGTAALAVRVASLLGAG